MNLNEIVQNALPHPVWYGDAPPVVRGAKLRGDAACDLAVIGGGLTGLWTAVEALRESPGRNVVVLEAGHVGVGASGRNGGFVSTSLTHGLGHGHSMWPEEMPELIRLGEQNAADIDNFVREEGIAADLRWCGKTLIATKAHEVTWIERLHQLHSHYGLASELLDREAIQGDVHSPTYLAGISIPSGGLVDPMALTVGLADAAVRRGARIFENSAVDTLRRHGASVHLRTAQGKVCAAKVVVATNAFRPLLRRLRPFVLPVWDHVLATEPLTQSQLDSIGWKRNQGLTDAGNQFHYYRRTADDRILWGGYDAIYYFRGRTESSLALRDASHELLARHFYRAFPQLHDVRMSHRWAGVIDTTSRFTPMFGTAMKDQVAYAVGYTGLGVASSRFGARVALDLLDGRHTERTCLGMVKRKPIPFPPEPIKWPAVQVTRAALARQDLTGRRGMWLSTLDRFGIGFDS